MIYLDHAASSPPAPEVLEVMNAAAREHFANPSSAHGLGAAAARALEAARERVAALLHADPARIVFTSGGTESDALGVIGAAQGTRGNHVVVSAIEHPAVLRSAEMLSTRGFEVTRVAPDASGVVPAEKILEAVRPTTALVALMLVNNELGTRQPVEDVAQGLARGPRRPHLHVDAVQACGFLRVDVEALGASSVAISGHKLRGPRGSGALWVHARARIIPPWDGGRQENALRSGTENLPAIAGLARAAELTARTDPAHLSAARDRFEAAVLQEVPGARPTVSGAPRAPHICSIALDGLPAEPILHALEARGVFASAGSACSSRTRGPSHVLRAIGVGDDTAVLRFSLGAETTSADLEAAVVALRHAVAEIRAAVRR